MNPLRPGNRVTITGRVAWTGFTGKITGPSAQEGLDWIVELETNGMVGGYWKTAVAARNLRRVRPAVARMPDAVTLGGH